jgi:hypothetical protein
MSVDLQKALAPDPRRWKALAVLALADFVVILASPPPSPPSGSPGARRPAPTWSPPRLTPCATPLPRAGSLSRPRLEHR